MSLTARPFPAAPVLAPSRLVIEDRVSLRHIDPRAFGDAPRRDRVRTLALPRLRSSAMAMTDHLPLESVVGFAGKVGGGLVLHPNGKTMAYPLGATIVVKELGDTYSQSFLQGHNDEVSCLAISRDGAFLASGQITNMGFSADIIVWDLHARSVVHRMSLHKVKVAELSFSHDGRYLASLGGQDDNSLVIWDVETGNAICGTPTPGLTRCVRFLNTSSKQLVTGGGNTLVVWDFDLANRKLRPSPCRLGNIRRDTNYITIDEQDEYMYVGTTSGDVLQVSLSAQLFKHAGPHKSRVPKGVIAVASAPSGEVVLGGGDGSVSVLERGTMRTLASTKLESGVTSCVMAPGMHEDGGFGLYAGTETCNIYYLKYSPARGVLSELIQTCHSERINDVAFPVGYSEVFATCGREDVRIWHINEARELLRIKVPNVECLSVAFMPDGGSVVTGWNDGKIRAFAPQSGRLLYTINDAHPHGVTCLVGSGDCARIVSGGKEGNVRVWRVGPESQTMVASMKEHKGPVNSIALRANDSECVSASSDGSAIIWDLTRFTRSGALTANTFFKACAYHPDESQVVTGGTDRKVTWWDSFDGQAIRVLDGSESAEINSLDISTDGEMIVTGGGDKEVKVWGYDEGQCFRVGKGHSGAVTKVKFTPDGEKIVSVGAEGAIFIWQNVQIP